MRGLSDPVSAARWGGSAERDREMMYPDRGGDDHLRAASSRTARREAVILMAEARLNHTDFINLSALTFTNGSVLASVSDRSAGTRRSRISQANRGKGGDHICAFS